MTKKIYTAEVGSPLQKVLVDKFEAQKQLKEVIDTYVANKVKEIISELESNPNEDGSISPNIQHWIEKKQTQLKSKFLKINNE